VSLLGSFSSFSSFRASNVFFIDVCSLIGSWGPLFLPLPWLAFREWWAWRFTGMSDKGGTTEPMTENIIVNYYYKKNPSIWTPWLVR
jgi:hypothetical protein